MLRREILIDDREEVVIRRNYRDRFNFAVLQNFNFKECFRLSEILVNFILGKI